MSELEIKEISDETSMYIFREYTSQSATYEDDNILLNFKEKYAVMKHASLSVKQEYPEIRPVMMMIVPTSITSIWNVIPH